MMEIKQEMKKIDLPNGYTWVVLFKPMEISIIFGLMYATILTLVVVPAFYVIIAKWKNKSRNEKSRENRIQ